MRSSASTSPAESRPLTFAPRLANLRLLVERGWPELACLCGDFLDPGLGATLADRLEDAMRDLALLPPTVVHGDAKPDNLLLRGREMVFVDWQAVGTGPPAWDVASCLVQCLTIEDRRANEAALLADYPHDLTGLEQAYLMSLVVAAALPALGDPAEPRVADLARTTAERAVAALQDSDVLPAN